MRGRPGLDGREDASDAPRPPSAPGTMQAAPCPDYDYPEPDANLGSLLSEAETSTGSNNPPPRLPRTTTTATSN
ncbi:hypothetical protein [Streptomyces sp. NPDC046909]|uniref:hypothetical protein n=1 Tax=Streptomyces sp. NPDC046909 TaxID=3155617 RepID=UPI0033EFB931